MENLFEEIISLENLFESWREFRRGKRNKLDVQMFERNLEDNIFTLHQELKNKSYKHSNYTLFYITDPKLRRIHKAKVQDRIVRHAVYRILYPIFDRSFIYDSYSCRINKGTHKTVYRLERFARKASRNYLEPCFVLKCDVQKFFDSINHEILTKLIKRKIKDEDVLWLINEIIQSFPGRQGVKGISIGNLTSQLFANIYLNELDNFIKHEIRVKYYLRYCDDFIILNEKVSYLRDIYFRIKKFLQIKLILYLNPSGLIIRKLRQGIDFLGYVTLPHFRVLRTKTKRRMFKKVTFYNLNSYLGLLRHCNGHSLGQKVGSSLFT